MGDDPSSRLNQRIKEEEQLVLDIGMFNSTLTEGGIIAVDSLLLPGKIDEARRAILRELKEIQDNGFEAEELARAKQQTLRQYYEHWETNNAMAHDLVANEVYTGDFRFSERYVEEVRRINASDVQRVAQQYLDMNQSNEVLLLPEELRASEGAQMIAKGFSLEGIERITLPNGLRILLLEDKSTPVTYASVAFLGGVLYENESNNGVCTLVAELLTRGVGNMGQNEIAKKVASWGGDLSPFSGQNSYGLTLSFISEYNQKGLKLFVDLIQKPSFPDDELKKVLNDQLEALLAEKEDIFTSASRELMKGIYEEHPYRLNPLGTEEMLKKLGRKDAIAFYEATRLPENMVVGVVGDIDAKAVRRELERTLGALKEPKKPLTPERQTESIEKIRTIHVTVPREQAVAMLAFNALSITDERRYAYQIVNTVLTGSAGRLYQNIRGEHGLSYVVGSNVSFGIDPGYFVMYAASHPKEAPQLMELLVAEAQKIRQTPITEEEIKDAKIQLVGNYEHSLESKSSLSRQLISNELSGLGYEETLHYVSRVRDVTPEDIAKVIDQFIHPEKSVRLIVGPGKQAPALEINQ